MAKYEVERDEMVEVSRSELKRMRRMLLACLTSIDDAVGFERPAVGRRKDWRAEQRKIEVEKKLKKD